MDRIWTIFEQYVAIRLRIKPRMLLPSKQEQQLVRVFETKQGRAEVARSFQATDVKTAKASVEADEIAIKSLIQKQMTFSKLNERVRDSLFECASGVFQRHVQAMTSINPIAVDKLSEQLKQIYLEATISLVSGGSMPLDDLFVQLAIVEDADQNTAEEMAHKPSGSAGQVDVLQQIHNPKKLVMAQNLFNGKAGMKVQKILLVGPAGIGKTTMVDKLCFDWARGKLWPQKFTYVFKVSLDSTNLLCKRMQLISFVCRSNIET